MRQPTRTDLVDAHNFHIHELRKRAIDAKTASRAFASLVDSLKALPSEGRFHDQARESLIKIAEQRAEVLAAKAADADNEADLLTEQGLQ
jgi:hypothetical protein